ncbi:MAG TPA: sigma-70 family RNA polymerase sigma factor [Myxococcota bacterium]
MATRRPKPAVVVPAIAGDILEAVVVDAEPAPAKKKPSASSTAAKKNALKAAARAVVVDAGGDGEKTAPEPVIVDSDEEEDDDDLVAAVPPADDDGDVFDVGDDVAEADGSQTGLVRARRVALPGTPGGDWVKDDDVSEPSDDEIAATTKDVGGGRDDIYKAFVRQATRVQRMSEEEERAMGLKVRDFGDQNAAKKLVVHNLRLVIKMAHQYRRSWTNIMDLIQEASAGMAIAAQRWDPDQGTRFGTYAVYWIRAQLTKFLMTNGRAIHTGNTRAGRKLYFQLPRVRRKLLAEGKDASIENIAKEVQETPEEVARIVARLDGREASLDAQVGNDDDGSTLGELIAGDDRGPEENAAKNQVGAVIGDLMRRFKDTLETERDRAIWTEHLIAHEPRSLVELGERYNVSKQRMGQLAIRIKRAFRRFIIDELGPDTQLHWLFASE